jgi:MFS family permease
MYSRRTKRGVFVLEGLNTFATTYYLYYLFFYMHAKFGFGRLENLALASLNGFVYLFAAIYGGRFAQKRGYFRALRFGFSTMVFALIAGSAIESWIGQVCVMVVATIGICFTWPTLEALACEREPAGGLQRMIGIYNLVWAGGGALAYFTGGAMLEKWGLRSMFLVPAAINLIQLALLSWIEKRAGTGEEPDPRPSQVVSALSVAQEKRRSPVSFQNIFEDGLGS